MKSKLPRKKRNQRKHDIKKRFGRAGSAADLEGIYWGYWRLIYERSGSEAADSCQKALRAECSQIFKGR